MSSPTPGSDPNYPQGSCSAGPARLERAAGQPGLRRRPRATARRRATAPPQGYGAPRPATAARAGTGQRPGMVTAAGDHRHRHRARSGSLFGLLGARLGRLRLSAPSSGSWLLLSVAAAVALLVGGIQAIQGKSPRLLLLGQLRRHRRPAC